MGLRRHLSFANVTATIALFVALGGVGYAATRIDGSELKNRSVPGIKLQKRAVTRAELFLRKLGKLPAAVVADRAAFAGDAATADTADTATRATSAKTATSASNAAEVDGKTAAQLTLACPSGTDAFAGVCFEKVDRANDTWVGAARTCGVAGRRLPSLDELDGFRQQPGILLANGTTDYEWTSAVIDTGGKLFGVRLTNGGVAAGSGVGYISTAGVVDSANKHPFRCVAYRTNG